MPYAEVPLAADEYLAVLKVVPPAWYREPETVLVVKCDGDGLPVSAAIVCDFT